LEKIFYFLISSIRHTVTNYWNMSLVLVLYQVLYQQMNCYTYSMIFHFQKIWSRYHVEHVVVYRVLLLVVSFDRLLHVLATIKSNN
jgi:hypothetical protein